MRFNQLFFIVWLKLFMSPILFLLKRRVQILCTGLQILRTERTSLISAFANDSSPMIKVTSMKNHEAND